MKNRKLLVPVRCTTRKFYLQPPPLGRNDWHVRFVPPSTDGVPREIFRSTGTVFRSLAAARLQVDRRADLTCVLQRRHPNRPPDF